MILLVPTLLAVRHGRTELYIPACDDVAGPGACVAVAASSAFLSIPLGLRSRRSMFQEGVLGHQEPGGHLLSPPVPAGRPADPHLEETYEERAITITIDMGE